MYAKGSSSAPKPDRKTIEKNRRDNLKSLHTNLMALVSTGSPGEANSVSDQLEKTVNYIKDLREKVEELKQKRTQLMTANQRLRLPAVEVHVNGPTVQVALTTGVQYRSMFKQVVGILQEEGADVFNVNISVVDQTVFHTIQAQCSGDEVGTERVCQRLKDFVYDIDGQLTDMHALWKLFYSS